MKIYLRILHYAPRLYSRLAQFLAYSIVSSIVGVVNIALAIPMLNMLFGYTQHTSKSIPAKPTFSFSLEYALDLFNYHFIAIIQENGPMRALLFICVSIII